MVESHITNLPNDDLPRADHRLMSGLEASLGNLLQVMRDNLLRMTFLPIEIASQ